MQKGTVPRARIEQATWFFFDPFRVEPCDRTLTPGSAGSGPRFTGQKRLIFRSILEDTSVKIENLLWEPWLAGASVQYSKITFLEVSLSAPFWFSHQSILFSSLGKSSSRRRRSP
jgi:hypothetical protein